MKTWCDLANLGVEEDAFKYIDKYVEFRKQGLKSVEAHEKISRLNYAWAWSGADKLSVSLEGFGKLTLTGYAAADTHADTPLFLRIVLRIRFEERREGHQGRRLHQGTTWRTSYSRF